MLTRAKLRQAKVIIHGILIEDSKVVRIAKALHGKVVTAQDFHCELYSWLCGVAHDIEANHIENALRDIEKGVQPS